MKQRINIAELLKDCPRGMELDCMMFDDAKFISIEADDTPICLRTDDKPICIRTGDIYRYLTKFGTWTFDDNAKCIIFPKGKTTWEGFHRPFKDGDIVSAIISGKLWYGIYKKEFDHVLYCYVSYSTVTKTIYQHSNVCAINSISEMHFATEEEKAKLFKAIKDNGYKWNAETNNLEKLIEPIFKIGDRVKEKKSYISGIITDIDDDSYKVEYKNGGMSFFSIKFQNNLELVPNKFDINTLKPFESKVLVRDIHTQVWKPAIYGFKKFSMYTVVGGNSYCQCIPYEGNEHLIEVANDCDDFYKTWEK